MTAPAPRDSYARSDRVRLRRDGLAWRQVVDDIVMLDTDAGRYHSVNTSGAALWEQLTAGCTVGDLVDTLVRRYPSAAPRAAGDVDNFLAQLDARRFLDVDDSPTTP